MQSRKADKIRVLTSAVNVGEDTKVLNLLRPTVVQHGHGGRADTTGAKRTLQADARIVRLLEDGPFVVAQLRSDGAGEDRFAVYRFDGEEVAEAWAFSASAAPPNKSGHTQVDGPAEPQHLEHTDENKLFARRYYETFHLAGDHSHNDEFFTSDVMIRHEPGVQDGLKNFLHDVEELMKHRTIDSIDLLIGQGDLVFIVASGTHEGKSSKYIDLYRIEQTKVVEHWGFPQVVSQDRKPL